MIQIRQNSPQHNGVAEVNKAWSFSQILSVVMVVANFYEVIRSIFGNSRRRERSHERRAEAQLVSS